MAQSISSEIMQQGITNASEFNMAWENGVRFMSGPFIAEAMPLNKFLQFIDTYDYKSFEKKKVTS